MKCLIIFLLLLPSLVRAVECPGVPGEITPGIQLNWGTPTTKDDGSGLGEDEIVGYLINHYTPTNTNQIGVGVVNGYLVENAEIGTHEFDIATNANYAVGNPSPRITVTVAGIECPQLPSPPQLNAVVRVCLPDLTCYESVLELMRVSQ